MGEQCSPSWILGTEVPTSRGGAEVPTSRGGAELLSLNLIYRSSKTHIYMRACYKQHCQGGLCCYPNALLWRNFAVVSGTSTNLAQD